MIARVSFIMTAERNPIRNSMERTSQCTDRQRLNKREAR
jgi:hypothetical protein